MNYERMIDAARLENARALAALLGSGDATKAEELLDVEALITPDDAAASRTLAHEIGALLGRTVSRVRFDSGSGPFAVEIVIGDARARSTAPCIYVSGDSERAVIRDAADGPVAFTSPHPIFTLLTACYVSGATIRAIAKGGLGVVLPTGALVVRFSEFGLDLAALGEKLDLGKTYLAGGGAIGNGLLWSLRHLNVEGELHIVDYDTVEAGNLQRQVWFEEEDIGTYKADALARKAQLHFPAFTLVARKSRLQELPDKSGGAWLRRLIVAVDSRRARRSLQAEMPGEVFDASTTDVREIVLHHHRQPTTNACLSCIYAEDEQEQSREQHIAAHLAVSVDQVRQLRVDEAAAEVISSRFRGVFQGPDALVGIAYESLFKSLCAQGVLRTALGKGVVAPFAFVSVLAGVLLAIELVRRLTNAGHVTNFNYWRISPWHPPIGRSRRLVPSLSSCGICQHPVLKRVANKLWGRPLPYR